MAELSPNSTVFHYGTVSKLGAAEIGEVWMAKESRLGRKVALKILPKEFPTRISTGQFKVVIVSLCIPSVLCVSVVSSDPTETQRTVNTQREEF